ncbi:MAG: hypothetical protein ACLSAC_05135 [Enterocloster bolteae]
MNILVGDKDLSELVETITRSGDSGQIARKLEFTIAKNTQDPNFPNVTINEETRYSFRRTREPSYLAELSLILKRWQEATWSGIWLMT